MTISKLLIVKISAKVARKNCKVDTMTSI